MTSPTRRTKSRPRGVSVAEARRLLLGLPGVVEGRSYGLPSFLINGRFFARLRDADTVLVVQLAEIADRDVLMRLDPRAFFCTDHYRDHPTVLVRLAEVPRPLLEDLVSEAHRHLAALPARPRARARAPRRRT